MTTPPVPPLRLVAGLALLAAAGGITTAQTTTIPPGDVVVGLELQCTGVTSPVYATHAGDGSGRLFVVDQAGTIRILDAGSGDCAPVFLDVRDRMVAVNPFFDERGLLGLAFHPDYERNGRFFVRYSAPREGSAGEPCFGTGRGCHAEVLSEFRVSADDPDRAVAASERVLLRVDEPQFNHNSGNVAFGPDGLLYFTLGDGGGANDGLADTPPSHGPIGNAQNIETLLGAILRIDVDATPPPGAAYAVPADNPFAGPAPGADEIYAYGLRNPYRFSFDDGPGGDGRLFLTDVGQNLFEEINVARRGGNYGWVAAEGFHCFDPFDPSFPPAACAGSGARGEPLLNPVAEYQHADGIAVVGGFVYRGSSFPTLYGKYVFGDFSRSFFPGDGRLFWLDARGVMSDIFEFRLGESGERLNRYLLGFGEDEDGEIYVLTSQNLGPAGDTGEVWRLTADDETGETETVCHHGRPIEVAAEAVHTHLVHGDALGACR